MGGKSSKGEAKPGKGDKERDGGREGWDSGGPTIPDMATAVQPYNCTIKELEVSCTGVALGSGMAAHCARMLAPSLRWPPAQTRATVLLPSSTGCAYKLRV